MEDKYFKIRPYARLLTMLGEQLIKNELSNLQLKFAHDLGKKSIEMKGKQWQHN